MVMSGIAGQGVQKVGSLIASAASLEGYEATYYPILSGNKRGGLTSCHVVIADHVIGAPERAKGNYLLLMDDMSVDDKAQAYLPGAEVIINSSLTKKVLPEDGCQVYAVPFSDIALREVGNAKTMSVVAFGFILALNDLFCVETAEAVLKREFGKKEKLLALNITALNKGMALAREMKAKKGI